MSISKIDVSRSSSVIFGLYFTRNKEHVRALKPNSVTLKISKAKYQKHFKINIFYSFIIWVIWSFVVRMCVIVTFILVYVSTVDTLTHISAYEIIVEIRTFLVGARPLTRAWNQFKNLQKNEYLLLVLFIKISFEFPADLEKNKIIWETHQVYK